MAAADKGRLQPAGSRTGKIDDPDRLTQGKVQRSLPALFIGAKLSAEPAKAGRGGPVAERPAIPSHSMEISMAGHPFRTESQIIASRALARRHNRLLAGAAFGAVVLAAALLFARPAFPQEAEPVIFPGAMAVSAFPGTTIPGIEEGLSPELDPIDETMIDEEGASVRVFDPRALGGPAGGQLVYTPQPFEVKTREVGLVFGLTYDDGVENGVPTGVPDLYAAATSAFGIQIVTPDEDADGRPERQRRGTPGATFMAGQWGQADQPGGPGSIYRIDGLSGTVSLFATIETNSGPGLGDIAFDRAHRQFFVSDLDTGQIARLSADGIVLDTFDHGVDGRPAHGLAPISDDGSVMDIGSASFDAEDPESWAMTEEDRRVHGVAVHGGRVWYAVGNKAAIWSVGINRDGTFAGDPRWELDVASPKDLPVTDIVFDNQGFMYLAQRGEATSRYDYSRFAKTGNGEVIRYWRENPDDPETESVWVPEPQHYAVGFPEKNRQTDGGIDLQYGYDVNGFLDQGVCVGTIAKTGDDLRNNPALSEQLLAGGPLNVHGVQLTPLHLVEPANVPPFGSWFIDQDGLFDDPDLMGHVGDVEIWRPCEGRAGWYDPWYPPVVPPLQSPCVELTDLAYYCTPAGLEADLTIGDRTGYGFDSVKANTSTPGTAISPLMQTVPPGAPYTIGVNGHVPGQTVDVNLCFYKDADAKAGGAFPCCKVTLPLPTPDVSCEP